MSSPGSCVNIRERIRRLECWDAERVKGEKMGSELHQEHQERAASRKIGEKGSGWSPALGVAERLAEIKAEARTRTGTGRVEVPSEVFLDAPPPTFFLI